MDESVKAAAVTYLKNEEYVEDETLPKGVSGAASADFVTMD